MAIKIIEEPDVRVTASALARYREQYSAFLSGYAGPAITLEEFIRNAKDAEQEAYIKRVADNY